MQDEPTGSKSGTTALQAFWYGSSLLAGGIVALTFALLYTNKRSQYAELEKLSNAKETIYILERDSLTNELKELNERFLILETGKEAVEIEMAGMLASNKKLTSLNAALSGRELQYKNLYSSLQATANKINSENRSLKDEKEQLQSQVTYLQGLLDERDARIARQNAYIEQQNYKIQVESDNLMLLKDSIKNENVRGFFNTTEVAGSIGMSQTDVPYSKYFFGVTNVGGYVINKKFRTGLGIGLYGYNGGWMLPVYLDFRFYFNEKKYTPYIWADGGFMFDFEDFNLPNTLFMNPGVGVYRNVTDNLTINLGVGPFVQMHAVRSSYVNFKLGLTFRKRR